MATNPIFTTEKYIPRPTMYNKIKQLFLDAGWVNESSNPATDYDVLTSTGESGTERLVIQLKKPTGYETLTSGNNFIYIRFPSTYVPGASGSAGVFGRTEAQSAFFRIYINYGSVDVKQNFNITYNVNKDRLILVTETAPSIAASLGIHAVVCYIGRPTVYYSPINSRGLVFATAGAPATESPAANYIRCCTRPFTDLDQNWTDVQSIRQESLNPVNADDKHMLSTISFGDTTQGLLGTLDMLYSLQGEGDGLRTSHNDLLYDGKTTYRVVYCHYAANNVCAGMGHYAYPVAVDPD